MKKYILTLSFYLLTAGFLFAQDNSTISLQLPVKKLDTSKDSIASIQVVSNLADSTFIGVLPSTFPNVRTNVVIPQGIQSWVQDYISEQFGNSYQPAGKDLLWVINTLRIGKDSSARGAVSFTKLTADVYAGSKGKYQLLNTFDTTITATELTTDFGESVTTAIIALYNNSVKPTRKVKQSKPSTQSAIMEAAEASDDLKILTDSVYPTGVFVSFQEFLNNSPSIAKFYTMVDTGTKEVQIYQVYDDSTSNMVPQVWGICVNNELYRYQNGQLYAIEKEGQGFTLSKYIDFRRRKNQAFFWRRYVGERQGDNNPFNDAHIYRTSINGSPDIKIEAALIDMNNGNISSY